MNDETLRKRLEKIEHDTLADNVSLASILLQCLALPEQPNTTGLRVWARREHDGYGQDDQEPPHRRVDAAVLTDVIELGHGVRRQVGPGELPPTSSPLTEPVPLIESVYELEALLARTDDDGRLVIPVDRGDDIAQIINTVRRDPTRQYVTFYRLLTDPQIRAVLHGIRTDLIDRVTKVTADLPDLTINHSGGNHGSSRDAGPTDVSISHNTGPVNYITTHVAGGNATTTLGTDPAIAKSTEEELAPTGWAWVKKFAKNTWGFLGTLAGIIVAFVAVMTWHPWHH